MKQTIFKGYGVAIFIGVVLITTSCSVTNKNISPTEGANSYAESAVTSGGLASSNSMTESEIKSDSSSDSVPSMSGSRTESDPSKGGSSSVSGSKTSLSSSYSSPEKSFQVSLVQWHPGIPGFDASYDLAVKYDGLYVNSESIRLSCPSAAVKVSGSKVIIPETVRNSGKAVTINAVYLPTGQKASLSIPVKTYTKTFGDEFDGTSLDTTKWNYEEYYDNGTKTALLKENHKVENGTLSLLGVKKSGTLWGDSYEYASGGIDTNKIFLQQYGCFLVSMKTPAQGGVNAAFWLIPGGDYGKNYGSFLQSNTNIGLAEIDIIEISANWKNHYYTTDHYYDYKNNYAHTQKSIDVDVMKDPSAAFHVYGCVWEENALYYYCDGRLAGIHDGLTGTSTGGAKSKRMYVILSLGLGEKTGGWLGGWTFDESEFPISMDVDWVRVYK